MPNWCENTLTIKGPDKTIKKFIKIAKARGTALSLNKFFPMPKELENTRAPALDNTKHQRAQNKRLRGKYGYDNWYDWRCHNWGIKWDVTAQLVEQTNGRASYLFDSPWAPPEAWLDTVAKKYPDLRFTLKYSEPGMGFRGCRIVKDTKIIRDSYYVNE